jgi:DNA-directed RNA polymerase specialized sigma24 family protein
VPLCVVGVGRVLVVCHTIGLFVPLLEKGSEGSLLSDQTMVDAFSAFVVEVEPRLRRALTATFGPDVGRDAAAEALAYAWTQWDRVADMHNPAGYLYRVGQDRGRAIPTPDYLGGWVDVSVSEMPWVEPQLPHELADLPEQQRVVFMLIHGYQWTFSEVAEFMDVTKSTVQTHEGRAMNRLRDRLGVPDASCHFDPDKGFGRQDG